MFHDCNGTWKCEEPPDATALYFDCAHFKLHPTATTFQLVTILNI